MQHGTKQVSPFLESFLSSLSDRVSPWSGRYLTLSSESSNAVPASEATLAYELNMMWLAHGYASYLLPEGFATRMDKPLLGAHKSVHALSVAAIQP